MDIDVKNIDKNDNNTWRNIYEAIGEPDFEEIKVFSKSFIEHCNKNKYDPQNFPSQIKKKIKTIALEESLYAQMIIICRKITDQN